MIEFPPTRIWKSQVHLPPKTTPFFSTVRLYTPKKWIPGYALKPIPTYGPCSAAFFHLRLLLKHFPLRSSNGELLFSFKDVLFELWINGQSPGNFLNFQADPCDWCRYNLHLPTMHKKITIQVTYSKLPHKHSVRPPQVW